MKIKLKITIIAFLMVSISGLSFAEDTKTEIKTESNSQAKTENNKKLNLWVDCGIGAMIFDNTAWAAATSNIIWDLGITATTSNIYLKKLVIAKKHKWHCMLEQPMLI